MNLSKKIKPLLILHKEMSMPSLNENYIPVLTPQFYTVKRESLPIKYAYKAKKIAPSLFEGLLETSKEYGYLVLKEEESWVYIAYDIDKVDKFLKEKGIKGKVYFAQQFKEVFSTPYFLTEKESLITYEDKVIIAPTVVLEKEAKKELPNSYKINGSGTTIEIENSSLISDKESKVLSLIFIFLALIFIFKAKSYNSAIEEIEINEATLLAKHPSLQSSYTRDGILSKYKTKERVEREKRESIKSISKMVFKGSKLILLDIEREKVKAKFECSNLGVCNRVEKFAKNKSFKILNKDSKNIEIERNL